MTRVFFHIHMWKTGGTSFFNICSDNFKQSFHRDSMLIQNWFLTTQQLRWMLSYHDWIRCYSCHMLSGDLPYDYEGREVCGIAFVRDPVNRFISSYNFQRSANYRGGIARDYDFNAFFIKALVEDDNPMWRNGQTFTLGGSGTEVGYERIADRVKNGNLILLPLERFDECCILLERLFPGDFVDCSYIKRNVTKRKQAVSDKQRDAIAGYMDQDYNVLALANTYLDNSLEQLFQSQDERLRYKIEFMNRCKEKKRKSRLIAFMKAIERKIRLIVYR